MSQEGKTGGFHFGSVGGNVQVNAGGDVVAGDKVSKLVGPFARDEDRANFQRAIQELKTQLEEIRARLDASHEIAAETKVQLSRDVAEANRELSAARDAADDTRAARAGPSSLGASFEKAGSILQRIESVSGATLAVADKIGPVVSRAVAMFTAARGLLGLP